MLNSHLSDLSTFVAIVEHGSLRSAAKALDVKPPAVSFRLARLEKELGVPLLIRTTRSIELTDAGRNLFQRSDVSLREISAAISDARLGSANLEGTLKIAISHIAFQYTLAPVLGEFQEAYPDIKLELSFDDLLVDLAKGGFHAGVRVGDLIDDDMVAVRLTGSRKIVHIASPGYLDRKGRPTNPTDLLKHDCIGYRFGTSSNMLEWEFLGPDGPTVVEVSGNLIVNSTNAQVDAAKLGLGIAWFGEKIVEEEIQRGELEVVLSEYAIERPPFYLYFPKEYRELRILRALVDFMKGKAKS